MLLTKDNIGAVCAAIEAALVDVGKAYGVKIQTGNMTLTPEGDTAKVQVHLRALLNEKQKAEITKQRFLDNAKLLGLVAEDFGVPFKLSGQTFRISGLHERNVKKCVLINGDDGKTYQVEPKVACQALHGTDWYFAE